MKKKMLLITAYLLLSATLIYAIAAGGGADDPLVSLSYLNSTYASTLDTAVNQKLDAADQALTAAATQKLQGLTASAAAGANCAATWTETRLKEADILSGIAGTNVLLLAGSVRADFSSGAVVDVSAGTELTTGTNLTAGHRYLVAEDTTALFTVTSKTAVVDYQGYYSFTDSNDVDYNALASALKTLHLFKGSYTGYGQGYDLELPPTRIQALIMFVRVLGEEDAALASSGSTPFKDIAAGSLSQKYVSYAYAKGYTNGYTATLFKPDQTITVNQYTEFLLRALGYSSTATTDLSDTLTNAFANNVITAPELAMLQADPFLRAELVYLSYYALDAEISDGSQTLRQALLSKGVFTSQESAAAAALLTQNRIS